MATCKIDPARYGSLTQPLTNDTGDLTCEISDSQIIDAANAFVQLEAKLTPEQRYQFAASYWTDVNPDYPDWNFKPGEADDAVIGLGQHLRVLSQGDTPAARDLRSILDDFARQVSAERNNDAQAHAVLRSQAEAPTNPSAALKPKAQTSAQPSPFVRAVGGVMWALDRLNMPVRPHSFGYSTRTIEETRDKFQRMTRLATAAERRELANALAYYVAVNNAPYTEDHAEPSEDSHEPSRFDVLAERLAMLINPSDPMHGASSKYEVNPAYSFEEPNGTVERFPPNTAMQDALADFVKQYADH